MTGRIIHIFFCTTLVILLTGCIPTARIATPAPPDVTSTPFDSPPLASIEINGDLQTAGLGSYCWNYINVDGDGVGACLDTIGLASPSEPIRSGSPMRAQLTIPVDEIPDHLQLSIFQAVDRNEVKLEDNPGLFRYWMPVDATTQDLPLESIQELKLDLEPGLYVFEVFVSWKLKGSASYGFLVEVQ